MVRSSPWIIAGIALSVAMLVSTPFMWRRLGPRRGLRWLAVAIVPAGLAMSGLATMLGRIGIAIGRFFASFVFSPFVWMGFALLAGAVGLELVSRAMRARGVGEASAENAGRSTDARPSRAATATATEPKPVERKRSAPVDDDMAEIEELLRRRGIT